MSKRAIISGLFCGSPVGLSKFASVPSYRFIARRLILTRPSISTV